MIVSSRHYLSTCPQFPKNKLVLNKQSSLMHSGFCSIPKQLIDEESQCRFATVNLNMLLG